MFFSKSTRKKSLRQRVEKRSSRYEQKRSKTLILSLVLSLAAASGIAFLIYKKTDPKASLASKVLNSTFFGQKFVVQEINVSRKNTSNLDEYFSKEQLLEKSGIKVGQSILDLDLEALQRKIEALTWISSVQVRKRLPDAIDVEYTLHTAKAYGIRSGRLWLVSETGDWIAPVTGKLLSLPVLAHVENIQNALEWISFFEDAAFQVNEINAQDRFKPKAIVVRDGIRFDVYLSDAPSSELMTRFEKVFGYIKANYPLFSGYIDLRMGKKLVVNNAK
ncbi:MAG: cell division protein FtsQ/DivIB [Bacteriovoracia bacterium]